MVMVDDYSTTSLFYLTFPNFQQASDWGKTDKTLNFKSLMLTWMSALYEVLGVLSGGSVASNLFLNVEAGKMSSFSIIYEGNRSEVYQLIHRPTLWVSKHTG